MTEPCRNHPEKKASSVCHSCGGHFCLACLTEGPKFFYCHSGPCRSAFELESREFEENKPTNKFVRALLATDETLLQVAKGLFPLHWAYVFLFVLVGWLPMYLWVRTRRCLVVLTSKKLHLIGLKFYGMSAKFHYSWPVAETHADHLLPDRRYLVNFCLHTPIKVWKVAFPKRAYFRDLANNLPAAMQVYCSLSGRTEAQIEQVERIVKLKRRRKAQRVWGYILGAWGSVFLLSAILPLLNPEPEYGIAVGVVQVIVGMIFVGPGIWLWIRGRKPLDMEQEALMRAAGWKGSG